jgi:hypothetical protein
LKGSDWVSGLCPLSEILNTRKYNGSETGSLFCFLVLRILDGEQSPETRLIQNSVKSGIEGLCRTLSRVAVEYIFQLFTILLATISRLKCVTALHISVYSGIVRRAEI